MLADGGGLRDWPPLTVAEGWGRDIPQGHAAEGCDDTAACSPPGREGTDPHGSARSPQIIRGSSGRRFRMRKRKKGHYSTRR